MIALDGNAIAGDLIEVLGADFAAAKRACASCGMAGFFAEAVVYTRGPGRVARFRACGEILAVLTIDCPASWLTDFRSDLAQFKVPTLVMHGDADRVLPISATGIRTHEAVKDSRLVVVAGAPHGMLATHADEVNQAQIGFLDGRNLGNKAMSRAGIA